MEEGWELNGGEYQTLRPASAFSDREPVLPTVINKSCGVFHTFLPKLSLTTGCTVVCRVKVATPVHHCKRMEHK